MNQQLFRQEKVPSINVHISEDLRESNKIFVGDQEKIIDLSCEADEIRTMIGYIINKHPNIKTTLNLCELWTPSKMNRTKSIPRPQNAFMLFRKDVSKEFYKANQSLSVGDSSIIASNRWNEISGNEKKFWMDLAGVCKKLEKTAPYVFKNSKFANITKQTFVDPPIIPSQHLNTSSEPVIPSSSITKSTHRPTARSSALISNITLDAFLRQFLQQSIAALAKILYPLQRANTVLYWDQQFTGLNAHPEPVEQSFTFETDFNPNLSGLNYDIIDPSLLSSDPSGANISSLLGFEPLYYSNSLEFGVIDPALLYLDPPSFTPFS
ncbi:471_t:CDS:2 [Acaulospora morrowiae]|uniref:471_t:CDS:1 n=1 Tax=Acaulospora morrowiae TaxID=94023 RepID=A0A9N8Z1G1_9GLOM|nr:471_t:CDS:2 [Acaulospora morrowiae]